MFACVYILCAWTACACMCLYMPCLCTPPQIKSCLPISACPGNEPIDYPTRVQVRGLLAQTFISCSESWCDTVFCHACLQGQEPSDSAHDSGNNKEHKKRKEPEPSSVRLPKKCPACKKANALERWKEKEAAYVNGQGPHPGGKPGPVKKAHVKDCPGYKQKGSGPRRKDQEAEVCACCPSSAQGRFVSMRIIVVFCQLCRNGTSHDHNWKRVFAVVFTFSLSGLLICSILIYSPLSSDSSAVYMYLRVCVCVCVCHSPYMMICMHGLHVRSQAVVFMLSVSSCLFGCST